MKKLIVIAGATASGKTKLAVEIAQKFNTQIISGDSRQCYREMNIGVAKPSDDELNLVPHYFINSHSIHDEISVADYYKYALEKLAQIFSENDIAVLTGGTGLYLKALCEGLDQVPQIDETIQEKVFSDYKANGIDWLLSNCLQLDPEYMAQAKNGEERNAHRLMRALIVKLSTGKSISTFRDQPKPKPYFEIEYHIIDVPKPKLYDRINERVLNMMDNGLIEEVKSLLPFAHLKNLQTIGYQELFSFLKNEIDLPTAIELLQQNSRHYAKRQITWFGKQYPNNFNELDFIRNKYLD
jgi:tRNA dimethylallyltransferase